MRAGIAQLMGSLKAEAAAQGVPVGVHTLSPGMVLTNLLLEGASDTNKQARLVCEWATRFAVCAFRQIHGAILSYMWRWSEC